MKQHTRNALAASLLAVLLAAPAAADETAAANEPTAETTRILMEVRQGAASEAGTPLTLTALLPLTFTVKSLHWSETTRDFQEDVKLTSNLAEGETYSFTFLPAGDIPNLALCAKPESGAELCWKPALSGKDGSLLMEPGFALKGTAGAVTNPVSLAGEWHDETSGRCHMKITPGQGGRLLFEVNWSDGASSNYRWRFSGEWEADSDALGYEDGVMLHRTSEDNWQTAREEVKYQDGTGSVVLKDGALYWNDLKENVCKDCVFRRAR